MNASAVAVSTVEDYLTNPALEHCEFLDGMIVPIAVGTGPHSNAQLNCGALLRQYFIERGGGKAFTELRCRIHLGGRARFYLPDIAVVLGPAAVDFTYLDRAPDLAVEVRSPDDSLHELFRKAADYLDAGSKAVWILEPQERCVYVLQPSAPPRILGRDDKLDAPGLLSGFEVAVEALFA